MKVIFLFSLLLSVHSVFAQTFPTMPGGGVYGAGQYPPFSPGFGNIYDGVSTYPGAGGIGAGLSYGGGASTYNFQGSSQETLAVFNDPSQMAASYRNVKVNASCPLLTKTAREDGDMFSELKSFLSTAARSPNCSFGPQAQSSISMMENMINGGDGIGNGGGNKCYAKNVELINQRNLAYYYLQKDMVQGNSTSFGSCLSLVGSDYLPASADEKKKCIDKKYDAIIEENKAVCRELIAPQQVQNLVNQGLVNLEQLLNQVIANKDECGFDTKNLFKVTMNTFLKTQALSVVGPWGAVAGFGVDLVGNLLDKLFPSDAKKAAALMSEILSEETFEQNACLYYNIQQKMYCEERPVQVEVANPGCQNIAVSSDLLKLIQKFKDIKKITDTYNPMMPTGQMQPMQMTMPIPSDLSTERETELLPHFDDVAKYTISNESDLRERVKALPKMQQAREQAKLESFINKAKEYQAYDPSSDPNGINGKRITNEMAAFFTSQDPQVKMDLASFVVRTDPGSNLESIKQASINRTIEQMMAIQGKPQAPEESSRTLARYNKYKTGMASLAKQKFEERLEKQFQDFAKQVKYVSSKDRGVVDDSVAEGQLRNLVRHCSLMQEVYDPNLEGKIPKVCQKLSCSNNKLGWFIPQKDQSNYANFKAQYCDKSLSYQKTENDFINELKDKSGAKICGVKAESFF